MTQISDQYWQKTGGDHPLTSYRNFQELFDQLPQQETFQDGPRYVGCIDEGDSGVQGISASKIGLGGSGIGYSLALNDLSGRGVVLVTSHEDCGAVALYAKENNITDISVEELGRKEAQYLAQKLGVDYHFIKISHMSRPANFHLARVLYYDGTGLFNPSAVSGLPKGFLITRGYISDKKYAEKLVNIALGIAFSPHSFNEKFTPASPFYLVVVADNNDQAHQLKAEVAKSIKNYKNIMMDRIVRNE